MKRLPPSLRVVSLGLVLIVAVRCVRAQHTAGDAAETDPDVSHRIMEAYPSALLASLERRNRRLADRLQADHGPSAESVIQLSAKWPQNATVTVAFLDGDSELHKKVADAASEWTNFCNIKLDFGLNPATGEYRRWKTSDQQRAADIRVSFDQVGYYSLVGTDSRDPQVGEADEPDGGRAYQRSMNYEDFNDDLPADYAGTVLHEFGHALGLHHEHQHPTEGCQSEFRWADDHGYVPTRDQFNQFVRDAQGRRPGIYTVLGGPPNKWSAATVNYNLRQLTESHAYNFTAFDRKSIMKYFFEDWMFVNGQQSRCFSAGENNTLSPNDKLGIWEEYPTSGSPPAAPVDETTAEPEAGPAERIARHEKQRNAALELLLKVTPESETEARSHYQSLRPD